jgi:stage II sporulation protein D
MSKSCILRIVAVFSVIALGAACNAAPKPAAAFIRVAIADNRQAAQLGISGKYSITDIDSNRVLAEGPRLSAKLTPAAEGVKIGPKTFRSRAIRIMTPGDTDILVDSRRFRGEIDIVRKDDGRILVINRIGLEDYLYGVLYHEVSHRWPMEVLKAQAITSRTFAMYQIGQNTAKAYDVRNDVYSQMYGGRTSEKWATTRAVNLTKGKVLTYKGEIFPAYFHATCAGHTEDASNLWKTDILPLKGVACGFCKGSKHYRWVLEIPLEDLKARLKKSGYPIDDIVSVSVLSKNMSGRAQDIEIKGASGAGLVIKAKEFRQMFGPDVIRSTKFDIKSADRQVIINGLGWGHGVGMCQWGAFGMACDGKKAEEILGYYYPGAEVADNASF